MSFISVYGESDNERRVLNVDTESNHPDDYYSVSLIRSEDYIRSNLKKYAIIRMPIVLTKKNYFLRFMRLNSKIDFITKSDLNDIVLGIIKSKKILGKTFNISGFRANSSDVVEAIYKHSGKLSILNRKIYYGFFEDGETLSEVAKVKCKKLNEAFEEEKYGFSSKLLKVINYPKYLLLKRKKNRK